MNLAAGEVEVEGEVVAKIFLLHWCLYFSIANYCVFVFLSQFLSESVNKSFKIKYLCSYKASLCNHMSYVKHNILYKPKTILSYGPV